MNGAGFIAKALFPQKDFGTTLNLFLEKSSRSRGYAMLKPAMLKD
jgi:hypothetical protein